MDSDESSSRTPTLRVIEVDVRLLELPLVEPFAAAHGTTHSRTLAVVRVTTDAGRGWGECSALPAATYSDESAAGSYELLTRRVAPALVGGTGLDGASPVAAHAGSEHPMARAAIEMALLDAELRAAGRSLGSWLGVERAEVPAGVSLGLDAPERVVGRALELVGEGYRRLKVKIQPGHDLDVVRGLRARPELTQGAVELQVDANGSYRPEAVEHLIDLARAGVDAIEQPFDPKALDAAAALVEGLATMSGHRARRRPIPVVGDEAVPSTAEARRLADRGALTGISVKPPRVGGLRVARALHDLCRERGLVATAGGMLESGLGRHALAAVAALPGFDLTGDLSPAGRWLAADPWPDLVLDQGRIAVPTGPGVCPDPDPDLLQRLTVRREIIRAETMGR